MNQQSLKRDRRGSVLRNNKQKQQLSKQLSQKLVPPVKDKALYAPLIKKDLKSRPMKSNVSVTQELSSINHHRRSSKQAVNNYSYSNINNYFNLIIYLILPF